MEISSTFWILDIADWWWQQAETHSMYADLSNVARDTIWIILHCGRLEASFSLWRDVVGWRPSKTTAETLEQIVIVRQYARANNGTLAGNYPVLDRSESDNHSELKREAEERKLHRMAKVHDLLEIWQGSQHLLTAQKESPSQNKQMTAVGYISDTEESVVGSWSLFHHDGAAAFTLSERSPLPHAFSAMELAGGWTQVLNVHLVRRIEHHPVECDEDSAPETVSEIENWLDWNGDLDYPNDSQDDCEADNPSDAEQDNCIEYPECSEQWDVCAAPNVPGLIRPTGWSKNNTKKGLGKVNATETRRIRGNRKK